MCYFQLKTVINAVQVCCHVWHSSYFTLVGSHDQVNMCFIENHLLTCKLPFWQYSVRIHWLGGSIHAPINRTMWSFWRSRIWIKNKKPHKMSVIYKFIANKLQYLHINNDVFSNLIQNIADWSIVKIFWSFLNQLIQDSFWICLIKDRFNTHMIDTCLSTVGDNIFSFH